VGLSLENLPHLERWCKRLVAMPAVQQGLNLPIPQDILHQQSKEGLETAGRKLVQ